jgi:3D (Asp-Asp-Asp) domain-containing protein
LAFLARQEYVRKQAETIAIAQAEEAKQAAKEEDKVVQPEPKRERIVVSRSSSEPKAAPIVFEATAYIALCDTGCSGITATGVDVRNTIYTQGHRIIAVDPSIIPLGSLVRVNTPSGSFSAIASDTGGHIEGHRIDILMGSKSKARAFGRQNVSIQILRNGAK